MVMLVAASGISVVAVVVQGAAEDRYDFQTKYKKLKLFNFYFFNYIS